VRASLGLRLPSIAATVLKSGFNLKFCPVLLTTLIRSTVGLKSKPNVVPVKEGTKVVPQQLMHH
jgi:hypothetical protein